MAINFFGPLSFLFNGGRGIKPVQIEWNATPADPQLTALLASGGTSDGSFNYEAVGEFAEVLGANQGGYELFDVGIALPTAEETHVIRKVDLSNSGNCGIFLFRLSDLDGVTAAAHPVWASDATDGTAQTAANARRFAIGQNRGFAIGQTTGGNYAYGNQNASASVTFTVEKVTAIGAEPAPLPELMAHGCGS